MCVVHRKIKADSPSFVGYWWRNEAWKIEDDKKAVNTLCIVVARTKKRLALTPLICAGSLRCGGYCRSNNKIAILPLQLPFPALPILFLLVFCFPLHFYFLFFFFSVSLRRSSALFSLFSSSVRRWSNREDKRVDLSSAFWKRKAAFYL